jgi:CheY-like chemotaxis protein
MPIILLVEDNLLNKELIFIFLKGKYELDHAPDGYKAIELANSKSYGAILMDINLKSDMDGLDTVRELKKMPGYENTPIAAVTGYTSEEDIRKILSGGCKYYLGKPFDKSSLLKLMQEMLEGEEFKKTQENSQNDSTEQKLNEQAK